MADSAARAYGVGGFTETDESGLVQEELAIKGFSVVESVLSPSEIEKYSSKLDEVYIKQVEEFGEDNLKAISDLNMIRCPLAYDDDFIDLVKHTKVREVIEGVFKLLYSTSSKWNSE